LPILIVPVHSPSTLIQSRDNWGNPKITVVISTAVLFRTVECSKICQVPNVCGAFVATSNLLIISMVWDVQRHKITNYARRVKFAQKPWIAR